MIYLKSINRSVKINPISIEDTQLLFSSKGYFTLINDFVSKICDIGENEKEIISLQDVITLFVGYRSLEFPNIEIAKGYYPIDFIKERGEAKSVIVGDEVYNSEIKFKEVLKAEKEIIESSNSDNIQQRLKMAIVACSHQAGYQAGKKILSLGANEETLSSYYTLLEGIEQTSSISLKLDTKTKAPILIISNRAGGKPVIGVPFRTSNFFAY